VGLPQEGPSRCTSTWSFNQPLQDAYCQRLHLEAIVARGGRGGVSYTRRSRFSTRITPSFIKPLQTVFGNGSALRCNERGRIGGTPGESSICRGQKNSKNRARKKEGFRPIPAYT